MPIIHNESIEAYHGSDYISHSKLEDFRFSPAYYYKKHVEKSIAEESSKDMKFGSAAHKLILEGKSEFLKRYECLPSDYDGKKKDAKELSARIKAEGKEAITDYELLTLSRMEWSIENNPACDALLSGNAVYEVVFRNTCAGLNLQCRADCWISDTNTVVDLKTCASLEDFEKGFFNYGYHRQAAFYRSVIQSITNTLPEFYFIAVEKNQPYRCRVYKASESALFQGATENNEDLRRLLECRKNNDFLKPDTEVRELVLPAWYK